MTSLQDNGIKPGSNVYAEMGSTCDSQCATRIQPHTQIASSSNLRREQRPMGHRFDWYGSPQDKIQAFRTFQISPDLRDKHGYAEITPALRAKIRTNALKIYPIAAECEEAQRPAGQFALPEAAVSRAARSGVCNVRAEDAARISESASLGLPILSCQPERPSLPHRRQFARLITKETQ